MTRVILPFSMTMPGKQRDHSCLQQCPHCYCRSRHCLPVQVLTDAVDSEHGVLALLCLGALAKGLASRQVNMQNGDATVVSLPQAQLLQIIRRLSPLLQVRGRCT